MADYEGLSEDELAALNEQERLEQLEQLAALTDAELEEYGSDRSDLAIETTDKPVRGGREVIETPEILAIEFDKKINIDRKGNLVPTYGDVEGITPDPVYRADRTIFKMNCVVEKIPAPKVNRVLGLTVFPKNIVTKGAVEVITDTNGEETEYPTNFIRSIGESIVLNPIGDQGTSYILVAKDVTNTKWYDWETGKFTNGYSEKLGYIGDGTCNLIIPSQSSENKYELFFKNVSSTTYEQNYGSSFTNIPSENEPWTIFQLPKATTTIRFKEEDQFISSDTTTITKEPLSIVRDINSKNTGEVDVSLTVVPKRGKLELIDHSSVVGEDVSVGVKTFKSANDSQDNSIISNSNLKINVSSDQSSATVSGTITFDKSSLRDSTFEIQASNFLKIIK